MGSSNSLESNIDTKKMECLKSLIVKKGFFIEEFSKKLGAEYFNTEVLQLALDSVEFRIIKSILDRTSKDLITQDMLEYAMKSNNKCNTTNLLFSMTHQETFSGFIDHIFKTKNVDLITDFIDNIPHNVFDKLLNVVKNTNESVNRDMLVEKLVDTFPKSITANLEKQIYQSALGNAIIKNLTNQILSRENNSSESEFLKQYLALRRFGWVT